MIKAIVPIKDESERLKNKNFLNFCGKPLYQIIIDTLLEIELLDQIIINTDSQVINEYFSNRYSKVTLLQRPLHLIGNEVTMNSIIDYDLSLIEGEHFLQTHVTNPLLKARTIVTAIETYFNNLSHYDSLFSVESVKKRVYDQSGRPINHSNEKLLQTQYLPEINIENSNLFLFSRTSFLKANKSRIGLKSNIFKMSAIEGIDIDYEEDFLLAQLIKNNQSIFN